jgi:hypothetical protein
MAITISKWCNESKEELRLCSNNKVDDLQRHLAGVVWIICCLPALLVAADWASYFSFTTAVLVIKVIIADIRNNNSNNRNNNYQHQ